MVDNTHINIQVNLGSNSEVNNSELANVNVSYTTKPLNQLLVEAYNEVLNEISAIQETAVKRELLRLLDSIKDYFIGNLSALEKVLKQVNCKLPKSEEKNIFTLVKLLSFLVAAGYTNNSVTTPNSITNEIRINEKNNWLFNAADFNEISLAKHISKIADYIARTPECKINNGNCYIAMLLNYRDINFCSNCEKGLLKDVDIKILSNLIDSNVTWQEDFFDLRTNKNIVFKCGKCVTNISRYEFSKEILGDI